MKTEKSDEDAQSQSDSQASERAPTLGEILREKRTQLGISVENAALETRISLEHLIAIERDEYDAMPSQGYLRGFVRNYSKYLELDADELVSSLEKSLDPEINLDHPDYEQSSSAGNFFGELKSSSITIGIAVFGVLVLGIAFGIWWIASGGLQSDEAPSSSVVEQDAGNTDPAPVQQSDDTGLASEVGDEEQSYSGQSSNTTENSNFLSDFESDDLPDSTPVSTETTSTSTSDESESPVFSSSLTESELGEQETGNQVSDIDGGESFETDEEEADTSESTEEETAEPEEVHDLEFDISDDTWIQVMDNSGAMLVNGLQEGPTVLTLDGEAPFDVNIGNAPAVKLRYRGEDIALDQYTQGNSASFTLHP